MNFTKTIFALAIGSVGIMGAMSASAAGVNAGDTLSITAGVPAFDGSGTQTNVSSGSWFAMDTNGNLKIAGTEKVALSEGTTGLVIGMTTSAGASHAGAPTAGHQRHHRTLELLRQHRFRLPDRRPSPVTPPLA